MMSGPSARFHTEPASTLWDDLDVNLDETEEEAEAFDQRVFNEIAWKVDLRNEEKATTHEDTGVARLATTQAAQYDNPALDIEANSEVPKSAERPGSTTSAGPQTRPAVPKAHSLHPFSAAQSGRLASRAISTPELPRSAARSTLPSVPTPPDVSTPLPAPLRAFHASRLRTFALETPDSIASPIDTPEATKFQAGQAQSASHPNIHPTAGSPRPLGSGVSASLKGKKDYQTLTKHFEDFTKTVAKRDASLGSTSTRTMGVKTRGGSTVHGLGGRVFSGLRLCMPPELGQVNKHKHRWDIISKLGGQVTLQPDTATTHIIWDGKSESALLKELGLSSFSDLPAGTICVKWLYVSQCKLTSTLLDPSTYLTFRNPFARSASANASTTLAPASRASASASGLGAEAIHQPFKVPSRLSDLTNDIKGKIPMAVSRKREHTASDSDTESPRKTRRAPLSRDNFALRITRQTTPSHVLAGPSRPTRPMDVTNVATEHRLPSGPGWEVPPENDQDGLDEFISGLKNGTIQEDDEDAESLVDRAEDFNRGVIGSIRDFAPGEQDHPTVDPGGERFRCGQKNDGNRDKGPNEFLAQKFEEMHDLYSGMQGKNPFAIRQYQQAASICRRTLWPITSGKEAMKIKGVGKSIADRIDEFLSGVPGRQFYEDNEQTRTIAAFKDIYGVGRTFANELYKRGARSIEDLRTHDFGLTVGQKIGVELYDDLKSRIPREECRQLYEIIRAEAVTIDPKVWIEIMGSYRRGQETSGDVDILITRDTADGFDHSGVLKRLVDRLQVRGIITHDLSVPSDWKALEAKWMGVGRLDENSKHRRIDILCIPFEQWGAALIYFTGNEIFNRSLRLYARKKGYSLNQRGLSTGVIRDKQGLKMTEGEIVASRTEKEIFDMLGLRWRPPHHRRP